MHPPGHRNRTTCARILLQRSIFHIFSSKTGRSFALPCGSFTQLMIVAPLFRAVPLLTVEMPVGVAQIASMASLSLSLSLCASLSLFFCAESLSLIPSPLLIPRANEVPHLVTAPIDAILIPAAPTGHLYERGGDEEAEAGERAREAVAVGGGALFAEMRVDAVV